MIDHPLAFQFTETHHFEVILEYKFLKKEKVKFDVKQNDEKLIKKKMNKYRIERSRIVHMVSRFRKM